MKEFDDWFYEPEGFALRAERCWEDIMDYQGDNPEVVLRWLRAAYKMGKEHALETLQDDLK